MVRRCRPGLALVVRVYSVAPGTGVGVGAGTGAAVRRAAPGMSRYTCGVGVGVGWRDGMIDTVMFLGPAILTVAS